MLQFGPPLTEFGSRTYGTIYINVATALSFEDSAIQENYTVVVLPYTNTSSCQGAVNPNLAAGMPYIFGREDMRVVNQQITVTLQAKGYYQICSLNSFPPNVRLGDAPFSPSTELLYVDFAPPPSPPPSLPPPPPPPPLAPEMVIDPNVINTPTLTNLTISGSAISNGFLVVFEARTDGCGEVANIVSRDIRYWDRVENGQVQVEFGRVQDASLPSAGRFSLCVLPPGGDSTDDDAYVFVRAGASCCAGPAVHHIPRVRTPTQLPPAVSGAAALTAGTTGQSEPGSAPARLGAHPRRRLRRAARRMARSGPWDIDCSRPAARMKSRAGCERRSQRESE
jgi:hypothetical protein